MIPAVIWGDFGPRFASERAIQTNQLSRNFSTPSFFFACRP